MKNGAQIFLSLVEEGKVSPNETKNLADHFLRRGKGGGLSEETRGRLEKLKKPEIIDGCWDGCWPWTATISPSS